MGSTFVVAYCAQGRSGLLSREIFSNLQGTTTCKRPNSAVSSFSQRQHVFRGQFNLLARNAQNGKRTQRMFMKISIGEGKMHKMGLMRGTPQQENLPRSAKRAPTRQVELAEEEDFIESTPYQRFLVGIFWLVSGTVFIQLAHDCYVEPKETIACGLSIFLAYIFSDLGTGVYHWALDNYGDKHTPVFGYQINAFKGHHHAPWTITHRDVYNNLYRLVYPTLPQMLMLGVVQLAPSLEAFWMASLVFIVLSQEVHKHAHMVHTHRMVKWLQESGLILSRKMHGRHHLAPFAGNYCIVSGWCNGPLDKYDVFRRLEALIYRWNGTEPRAWKLDKGLKERALLL